MPETKPERVVETCQRAKAQELIDAMCGDYQLVAMTGYQVGTGYGSFVEIMMVFELRHAGNGRETNGRQRAKSIAPISPKISHLTDNGAVARSN